MKLEIMNRFVSHILGLLCFIGTEYAVMANPTGGQVAAGAASIAGQGTSAVEVKQASNLAIINWQTFSIASGESTTFVQPSAASATLNRVLGGETSLINGTLSANGSIFLINGNGTVVGPGGVVRANAFTDSTRDISDDDFLAGNLHFVGSNPAGVQNFGTIHALGGDVVLIGKTVDNEGTITAVKGTAGLVAGDDVLLGQKNGDGSTIKVNPDTFAATDQAAVGIKNTGKVLAASAELKSANGNIYALAIQNEGTIRATTVKKQGGHIWMTSDSGTILNSGTLDASARSAHGHGGSVAIQAANGAVENTGHILAAGGRYGIGGLIETSGHAVQLDGTINAGQGGQWLIDPVDLTIDSGAATTIEGALNGGTSVVEVTTATGSSGAGTTTTGSGNIDVDSGINWATSASLTLSAYDNINVNANIVSSGGGAVILRADNTATGIGTVTFNAATISTSGPVSIFYNPNNPGGTNPRTINGTEYTTPTNYGADVTGGAALTSYMLVNNVDDLQNAQNNLNGNYALGGSIDATATAGWNGGAGFNPIGNQSNSYNGIFDGQGYTIDGLTINRPSSTYTGLFSNNSAGSVLENIGLINENLAGASDSGGLVGSTRGIVDSCYVEGTVTATGNFIGGLAGLNYGTVKESFFNGQVNASGGVGVGGLLGVCVSGGTATMDYSTGTMNTSSQFTGGLVGSVEANGSVTACYSSMQLESAGSNSGGLIGFYGINPGPVQNNYWLHDGVNSGLSGIGSTSLSSTSPSNSSASPETLAQLQQESTFQPMGTGAGQWDFTPGTGVWVIGGNFNNGTPYFRYQVIAVVLTADDQTTYYSGTNTGVGFSNSVMH
jgi:filamentous hemagglutinin family protein